MLIFEIIVIAILSMALIFAIVATSFYRSLPQIHDRAEWKIWKECYNDGHFMLERESTLPDTSYRRYASPTSEYYILVYYRPTLDRCNCSVFNKENKVVFSSFYRKHADKLLHKVYRDDMAMRLTKAQA